MKLSRRGILALAVASQAIAQTPPPAVPPTGTKPDPLAAAREENRHSAEALANFDIPMATEPAFVFRP
jgi:hypothetical protein